MLALQRGAGWAEETLLGALWQSFPPNGRVHLHIIDQVLRCGPAIRNANRLTARNGALSMRVPNPSPMLDKILHP